MKFGALAAFALGCGALFGGAGSFVVARDGAAKTLELRVRETKKPDFRCDPTAADWTPIGFRYVIPDLKPL